MNHFIDKTFTLFNVLLIFCVVYFPFQNHIVQTVMGWWWFRLSFLILIMLYVIVLRQHATAILTSVLFVFGASVSNNRFVSIKDNPK